MAKKILHVVSGLDPKDRNKETTTFEKTMKEIYRQGDPEIQLSFTHNGEDPYAAADLIRKKSPVGVIFDLSVPVERITSLSTAIRKRFSGSATPKFVRISGSVPESDCIARNHDGARLLFFQQAVTA